MHDPTRGMYHSGHICADCEEDLLLAEEVVLVQVVLLTVSQQGIQYAPFERPDESYVYEPYMFHQHCWDEALDALQEYLEEDAPLPLPHKDVVFDCEFCNSSLIPGELMCLVQHGTMSVSRRTPNGEASVAFSAGRNPSAHLCLYCARILNDNVIEMWSGLSHCGECVDCTYERVWRRGIVCDHEPEPDEE